MGLLTFRALELFVYLPLLSSILLAVKDFCRSVHLLRSMLTRYSKLIRIIQSYNYSKMSAHSINPVENSIREKLTTDLNPHHLDIINESYMHNVPRGSETHFKVVVVSNKFENLSLLQVILNSFFQNSNFFL